MRAIAKRTLLKLARLNLFWRHPQVLTEVIRVLHLRAAYPKIPNERDVSGPGRPGTHAARFPHLLAWGEVCGRLDKVISEIY